MRVAGELKASRGRPRARGEAKARRARPSARPERDAQPTLQTGRYKERDPKGAAPLDSRRPTRQSLTSESTGQGGRTR